MKFFLDTETTGLPKNYKAPVSDLKNWPRLIQVAWLVTDDGGKEIKSAEYIIKPDGFSIPAEAARIHGITDEIANRSGVALKPENSMGEPRLKEKRRPRRSVLGAISVDDSVRLRLKTGGADGI